MLFSYVSSGSAPPWSPTDLPNLELWLDAADTSTITGGATASQWDDKSGNGFNATSSGSLRPSSGTRTVNSLNAMDFSGSNGMAIPAGYFNAIEATNSTTLIAFECDATSGQMRLINGLVSLSSRYAMALNNTNAFFGVQSTAFSIISTAITRDTSIHIGLFVRNGATQTIYYDGNTFKSSNASGASPNLDSGSIGYEAVGAGANWYNGALCEIIGCSADEGATNINLAANYLAAKWGSTWVNI